MEEMLSYPWPWQTSCSCRSSVSKFFSFFSFSLDWMNISSRDVRVSSTSRQTSLSWNCNTNHSPSEMWFQRFNKYNNPSLKMVAQINTIRFNTSTTGFNTGSNIKVTCFWVLTGFIQCWTLMKGKWCCPGNMWAVFIKKLFQQLNHLLLSNFGLPLLSVFLWFN